MSLRNILLSGIFCLSFGCIGVIDVNSENDDPIVVEDPAYVNTYVSIPYAIKLLISPYVKDYFSPYISRYCDYLYPPNNGYNPYNLPCYVRNDFNGDGINDYAFLFSNDKWSSGYWYITTKLLVVLSSPSGYELSCEETLGTVSLEDCFTVEEFWSIRHIPAGHHTVVTCINNVEITETIYLENNGFYLSSIDPDEEAILSAEDDLVYIIEWDKRKLVKRSTQIKQPKRSINNFTFPKNKTDQKPMLNFAGVNGTSTFVQQIR